MDLCWSPGSPVSFGETDVRIALVCGYFDWFSGYQEVALAEAFSRYAEVEVIAGDRVSPIFNDAHLEKLGRHRAYDSGTTIENGVTVTRFPVREVRSMVWSSQAVSYLRRSDHDLVVQVMPGQGLPIAASLASAGKRRVALYGDNAAMWLALPQWKQALKWVAFTISKGLAYRYVNSRAVHAYGYTPDTITRLRGFFGSTPADVLPLAYDADRFFHDADLRRATRSQLGLREDDVLVITVGKFQRYKGIEDIVEAVDRTSRQDVNLRVLLVGADSSEYSDEIRAMVAGRDQDAVPVEVLDFRDAESLNALYNAADIGVWPRLPAISIQQAMGTGLFVVLPQNQWVGHLVEPGTGKYFEAELGIEGLARALDEYSGADRTDERRDERARRNSRFSGDGIARQVLEHVGLSH